MNDDQLGERIEALGAKIDGLADTLREETAARRKQIDGYTDEAGVHVPGLREQSDLNTTLIRGKSRNFAVAVAAIVIAIVAVGLFVRWNSDRLDDAAASQKERGTAFCHSLDDFGAVVSESAKSIIANPSTLATYTAAVNVGIVQVKARNGFSPDCTQIDPPPTTTKPGG